MKVYISIPYKFMAKVDYTSTYQKISDRIKKNGNIPVLPDIDDNRVIGENKQIIANHLKANVSKLLECESIVSCDFASCSRICKIEMAIAKLFYMDILYNQRIQKEKILQK